MLLLPELYAPNWFRKVLPIILRVIPKSTFTRKLFIISVVRKTYNIARRLNGCSARHAVCIIYLCILYTKCGRKLNKLRLRDEFYLGRHYIHLCTRTRFWILPSPVSVDLPWSLGLFVLIRDRDKFQYGFNYWHSLFINDFELVHLLT